MPILCSHVYSVLPCGQTVTRVCPVLVYKEFTHGLVPVLRRHQNTGCALEVWVPIALTDFFFISTHCIC